MVAEEEAGDSGASMMTGGSLDMSDQASTQKDGVSYILDAEGLPTG